jgi:hypothetical protein
LGVEELLHEELLGMLEFEQHSRRLLKLDEEFRALGWCRGGVVRIAVVHLL